MSQSTSITGFIGDHSNPCLSQSTHSPLAECWHLYIVLLSTPLLLLPRSVEKRLFQQLTL